jgi:hypothetical protein
LFFTSSFFISSIFPPLNCEGTNVKSSTIVIENKFSSIKQH